MRSALVKIPGVINSKQTTVTAASDSAVVQVKKGSVTAKQLVEAVAGIDRGYVASPKK